MAIYGLLYKKTKKIIIIKFYCFIRDIVTHDSNILKFSYHNQILHSSKIHVDQNGVISYLMK